MKVAPNLYVSIVEPSETREMTKEQYSQSLVWYT